MSRGLIGGVASTWPPAQVSDGLAWCEQPAVGASVPPEDAPEPWRLPVYAVRVEGGLVFVSERPTGPCLEPVTSDEYGRREGRAEAPPPEGDSGAAAAKEHETKACVSM